MQAPVFDGITRDLGAVSTRRSFMRLFGGAAAMGAVTLVAGGETQAKATRRGRSQGQGQVSAQGKGKKPKITICYQNQTRTVKKKGYQSSYPGATVGACTVPPPPDKTEPVVCTTWILSGGPDPTTPIVVDDDLTMAVNGKTILEDANGQASTHSPVVFAAQVGNELAVGAWDEVPTCRSLSPLWLHCATSGQKRQLFAGNNDGCAAGRAKGYFVNERFTISV